MRKTWRISSTHRKVKGYLNKTRRGHKEDHAQVRGKEGKASEGYTDDLVEEIVNCILEVKNQPIIKPAKKPTTKEELEAHQEAGHHPFDQRCKECLLAGIQDGPHFRRKERTP